MHTLRLVTLDLDDTLWAIAPVIARAENVLHGWLTENCPATASQFSPQDLRALRQDVEKLHPELGDDITALRRQSILLALQRGGDDEALADAAFDAFWSARNTVDCFEDVFPALARLKSKFLVAAITNGNACVKTAGLGEYFDFTLSARDAGCAKPGREIFRQACKFAGVQPHETLHAGDDIDCDVRGALAAGMHAAWIHRDTRVTRLLAPPALTFPDLTALADHLAA
ncbi:MAG TPA: HAD-IA family hydrolase [Gammaproteobacteria bacterium]